MTKLFERSGAHFSYDERHRYCLWRIWDKSKPIVLCIGLNPSTANAEKTDPTITNMIKMCELMGYGGFYMMNCWTFISSKPELIQHNEMSDRYNDDMITLKASECKDVIFAWGNFKVVQEKGRDKELIEMFPRAKCFGKNKNGTPMHPLSMMYKGLTSSPKLIPFNE